MEYADYSHWVLNWCRYLLNFRQWRARVGNPMPGLIAGPHPCADYPQRVCVQCGGSYDQSVFYYSNGRGGKRPRCIGCIMTRRDNQKWVARTGQPRYRDLPFIPLRKGTAEKRVSPQVMREKFEIVRLIRLYDAVAPLEFGSHCWRIQREIKKLPQRERAGYIACLDRWIQAERRRLDYPPWWIDQAEDCGISADSQPSNGN
jgi:hypothetical protein